MQDYPEPPRAPRTRYPVVMHDETLARTTNCSGQVQSKTLTKLARCDAGSWFAAGLRGEPIPTLGSALQTIASRSGSVTAILHISQDPLGDRAGRVRDSVARAGMSDRVIILPPDPRPDGRQPGWRAPGLSRGSTGSGRRPPGLPTGHRVTGWYGNRRGSPRNLPVGLNDRFRS